MAEPKLNLGLTEGVLATHPYSLHELSHTPTSKMPPHPHFPCCCRNRDLSLRAQSKGQRPGWGDGGRGVLVDWGSDPGLEVQRVWGARAGTSANPSG